MYNELTEVDIRKMQEEIDYRMRVVRPKCVEDLKSKGIGIIYITHRLSEVFQIATDVAIMRDGKVPVRGKVSEFTREILVKGLLPPDAQELSLIHI